MQINIVIAESLPNGEYGARATIKGNVMTLVADPALDPATCGYAVAKGAGYI